MKNSLDSLYLSDIGHTNVKILKNGELEIIPLSSFSPANFPQKIFYINVNLQTQQILDKFPNWINIANLIEIDSNYKNLGIDRQVVIFDIENGIVVDLGTAITVDIVKNRKHLGGYILLGKNSTIQAFQNKTSHLKFSDSGKMQNLPNETQDALYFGFFHQLKFFLQSLKENEGLPVILTGGDSQEFSQLLDFPHILNSKLIFENMKKIITLFQSRN